MAEMRGELGAEAAVRRAEGQARSGEQGLGGRSFERPARAFVELRDGERSFAVIGQQGRRGIAVCEDERGALGAGASVDFARQFAPASAAAAISGFMRPICEPRNSSR